MKNFQFAVHSSQAPVVSGETRVFDEREVQMRRDALRLQGRTPLHEEPLLCAAHDCGRVREPGSRHCRNCNDYLSRPIDQRAASTAETILWIIGVIGAICVLGYELAPYIYATLRLWVGGLQ